MISPFGAPNSVAEPIRSGRDLPDRVGTSQIGPAADIGAGKTERRTHLSFERLQGPTRTATPSFLDIAWTLARIFSGSG